MSILGSVDFTQFRAEDNGSTKQYRFGIYRGPKNYSNFYTNGGTGDTAVAGDFKLGQLHIMFFELGVNAAGTVLSPRYITAAESGPAAGGILWFNPTTGAEVANGTDLSGYAALFEAMGI